MRRLYAVTPLILMVGACQEPAARVRPTAATAAVDTEDVWALPPFDPWAPRDHPMFGATEPAPAPTPVVPAEPAATIIGSATAEPISLPSSREVVTAMHQTAIHELAIADDGSVAVSADLLRSVRLWPSLDGKREPVVLPMRAPIKLAIARSGNELVVAGLDDAGQLELVRTSEAGEVRRRAFVEAGRPLVELHATARGVIAVRDDRAIVAFTLDGDAIGTLSAEPGEHVTSISVRHDRVLAMLETGTDVRGRWLELTTELRWGVRTHALPIGPGPVALSPDGTRLAGISRNGKSVPVLELATGHVLARPYKETFVDDKLAPVGFLDNDVLAIRGSGERITWWGRNSNDDDFALARGAIAAGDKRMIGDSNGALALTGSVNEDIYYLGYKMGQIDTLLPSGSGFIASDTRGIVELDASLHTRAVYELPAEDARRSWYGVTFIDATHVIATSYSAGGSGLYIVNLSTHEATLIERNATSLGYHPTTRLLAYQSPNSIRIVVYDPRTGTFGESIPVPLDLGDSARAKVLDPATSRGYVLAFATTRSSEAVEITLVKSFDPNRSAPFEMSKPKTIHVAPSFWDENGDGLSLLDRVLPTESRVASTDRTFTAELHEQRLTLRDKAGTEKWTVPSAGATGLVWTSDGSLVAYGPGIARIDVSSGAIADRQCGWRFGRWDVAPAGFGATTLCEAPAHF